MPRYLYNLVLYSPLTSHADEPESDVDVQSLTTDFSGTWECRTDYKPTPTKL